MNLSLFTRLRSSFFDRKKAHGLHGFIIWIFCVVHEERAAYSSIIGSLKDIRVTNAAQVAAQAGLSVLLLEKRQEIGSPVRCTEGVGSELLAAFIEPDSRWIAAEIRQSEIITLANGERKTLRVGGGMGYVLERRIFDRCLAELACQAGVEVRVKTRKEKLSKAIYGTSHVISLDKAEYICEEGLSN